MRSTSSSAPKARLHCKRRQARILWRFRFSIDSTRPPHPVASRHPSPRGEGKSRGVHSGAAVVFYSLFYRPAKAGHFISAEGASSLRAPSGAKPAHSLRIGNALIHTDTYCFYRANIGYFFQSFEIKLVGSYVKPDECARFVFFRRCDIFVFYICEDLS